MYLVCVSRTNIDLDDEKADTSAWIDLLRDLDIDARCEPGCWRTRCCPSADWPGMRPRPTRTARHVTRLLHSDRDFDNLARVSTLVVERV